MDNGAGNSAVIVLVTSAQRQIDRMLLRQATFSTIETMIENIDGLDQDQKAALWLYAWTHQPMRVARREARVTLALLAAAH